MTEIRLFLLNLKEAAASPYALAAYLAVLLAWALIAFRVNRNKQLLHSLEKLPEKDRLEALRLEMGRLFPGKGLSSAQYLRYVQKRYYFSGFALLAVLGAGLLASSWYFASFRDHGTVSVDATPTIAQTLEGDLLPVSYQYQKLDASVTKIFPVSDYLDSIKKGKVVEALPPRPQGKGYFSWSFPEFSIKSMNTTRQGTYFSELVITITKSEVDEEPVLVLEDFGCQGGVGLTNDGWGPALDPILQFDMSVLNRPSIANRMNLDRLVDFARLDFSQFLPEGERRQGSYNLSGRVSGKLFYTNARGSARELRFVSGVSFAPCPAPAFPPSPVPYNVRLLAGIAPSVVRVPISQLIGAGGADHFLLRIGCDRSGHFEFTMALRGVDGKNYPVGSFLMDTFVPQSAASAARQMVKGQN